LVAAQSCAPYLHPRLTAGEVRVTHGFSGLSDEQLLIEARALEGKLLTVVASPSDAKDIDEEQPPDGCEAVTAESASDIADDE
jgi:hypothetical protein